MIKIQFCAGGNPLPGWRNHDMDVDITKPLPCDSGIVDLIFVEHGLEHISPPQAWGFMKECRRILKDGGTIRIAVPSIERVFLHSDHDYLQWMSQAGFGRPTKESAVENLICNHGHLTVWSVPLLVCCFSALGFRRAEERVIGISNIEGLRGLEHHGKVIGDRNNAIETIVVEATK